MTTVCMECGNVIKGFWLVEDIRASAHIRRNHPILNSMLLEGEDMMKVFLTDEGKITVVSTNIENVTAVKATNDSDNPS